jgi:hypothetical protein
MTLTYSERQIEADAEGTHPWKIEADNERAEAEKEAS